MKMVEAKRLSCKTVGHSTDSIGEFIAIIKSHSVDTIIDVRSTPYSRYTPQFNREDLKKELARAQIEYGFLGDSLGARYIDPNVLFPDGRVNFKKVRRLPKFQEGINNVIASMANGFHVALMCTEKDPFDCHRFVLISPALVAKGVLVEHIIDASKTISQKELEARLLKNYDGSLSIFAKLETFQGQEVKTSVKRLDEVYELRNKEIAYNGAKKTIFSSVNHE